MYIFSLSQTGDHHTRSTKVGTKCSSSVFWDVHCVLFLNKIHWLSCADPEGDRGSGPPEKKNIGFSSNTGPDPLRNHCYQASIQCWAIIGTPAKRHLMAFRWQADDVPLIVVLGSSLPSSTKKNKNKKQKKTKQKKTKIKKTKQKKNTLSELDPPLTKTF